MTPTTSTDLLTITAVTARGILDSRGIPTVEVRLTPSTGPAVVASAPAGASTGEHEAVELRDGGPAWGGRGVDGAVAAVTGEIADLLTGTGWASIGAVDDAMLQLDGTGRCARLGANAIVAVSIAATRAFAQQADLPLHAFLAAHTNAAPRVPVPHFNVINGGAHAANDLAFQEVMIAPVGAASIEDAIRAGSEIYQALRGAVRRQYGTAGLGDEGGFAPPIADPRQALDLLVAAITDAGYRPGTQDVAIAMDPAANGFETGPGRYRFTGRDFSSEQLIDTYIDLVDSYPIRSIEDGMSEHDIDGWAGLHAALAARVELVGDDLYVTDPARITDGATRRLSNAALIKPNQIGTVSDTLRAIGAAHANGMAAMVSHRSGETLDTFIADLAIGTGVGRIKAGAPARGERVAKYNRLTEIALQAPELPYGLA